MKNIISLRMRMLCVAGLVMTWAHGAQMYCHKALTQGGKTIYMTAKHMQENNYQLLIEADENLTGLGGSFVFVNGNEPYQLNANGNFVLADDKRTITCNITSSAAPVHYTPLYVLFENGGETNFGQPDADYTQTCEGGDDNPNDPNDPDNPDNPDNTDNPTGWNDIEWLGNGSGNEAYTQMYKIRPDQGQQVANIQVAPWDNNNVGIYTWVESGVESVSVAAGIQGAGVLLHLDAFTMEYTEVNIVAATKTYKCTVYYKNGIVSQEPVEPDPGAAVENTGVVRTPTKAVIDGQLVIIRDGHTYTAIGAAL